MRIANWQPEKWDMEFAAISTEILIQMGEAVAEEARSRVPGFPSTVTRPAYKSGPYAGEPWTARTAGSLKKTIRVVEKHDQHGKPLAQGRNVRVYAGNYLVYYAAIVNAIGAARGWGNTPKPGPGRGYLSRSLAAARRRFLSMGFFSGGAFSSGGKAA